MPEPTITAGIPTGMTPAAIAAMKEDLAAYKTDYASGETNHSFEGWLKTQRPERWETYLKVTGQGR